MSCGCYMAAFVFCFEVLFHNHISCSAEVITSDRGKRTSVGNSRFCLQLSQSQNFVCVQFLVNSPSPNILHITLNVMPNK